MLRYSSTSLFLLLVLFVAFATNARAASPEDQQQQLIPTSAPDIYPDEDVGPFVGMVEVTIAPNAPNCDIHYQLNTSGVGTSREPDAADKLLTAENSPIYNGRFPIQITAVGRTKITAICVPTTANDRHGASRPTIHYYTVLPADIDPPVAEPPSGSYVGSRDLVIRLHEPLSMSLDPIHLANDARCDIMYSIDDPSPGEQWVTLAPGGGVELGDVIGQHVIYAKCVLRSGEGKQHKDSGKSSAVVRFTYDIRPPLLYDVGSECSKCGYKPMHGQHFTVVLQGAEKGDVFFLTTSVQGCDTQHHQLDHSERTRLADMKRAFKFWGSEPGVSVWVCLRKKGQNGFRMVQRRKNSASTSGGRDEHFFVIEKSVVSGGGSSNNNLPPQENTRPPASPINVQGGGKTDANNGNGGNLVSSGSGFNFFALLLAFVLILGAAFVMKLVRVMMKHDKPARSTARRTAVVVESESMVEAK